MASTSARNRVSDDDQDRQNRFVNVHDEDPAPTSLRERAASQPPRSSAAPFLQPSPNLSRSNVPWPRHLHPNGMPQSVPTRSSSFSTATSLGNNLSVMRESSFASTFEDDESEAMSDTYDERYTPNRGRNFAPDLSRSRSQSLATTRPAPVGGSFSSSLGSWDESGVQPVGIPGRYGDIKPPVGSRYGSLGTIGRSLSNNGGNGFAPSPSQQRIDPSNMSPFMRDVGQILLDEGSAFRELWAGMHPPRDSENGGGGSGTTSRRHSVSVVQARRPTIVGFNAPGVQGDLDEPAQRPGIYSQQSYGGASRGGLLLTDEDLADDLGMLSLGKDGPGPVSSYMPPSQPSSLPIYAPHSRSPPTQDRVSPYRALNLSIPHGLGSPSEGGGSPSLGHSDYESTGFRQQPSQVTPNLARFVPGQGIKYLSQDPMSAGAYRSPVSPTNAHGHPQGMFSTPLQRRPSNAEPTTPLHELGKGVPLHSVPASCPLYIVEFKAGRTDLFYCTDLSLKIVVGDLVIVEADRGKDLGKVINDTITHAEVEAIQAHQAARSYGEQPTSPGGTPLASGGPQKGISPKMIYSKASQHDTQGLATKLQDEIKALQLCQSKVRQKKLPMEVVDAEYQWDRRKLTFYFVAEKRIDFRELVRELFRLYKTRIWMSSLQAAFEQ
ncbi:PSP1 C-terminal conserved region-domain-containing protein [Vararia minispora EC-137]|uniref:PSP1 C-terminal conserved region-domain-containing protein n=1 Tax=Vararia minispora EC-137 TaxID=1314806 RepID=A0ACB8QRT9_9AGAM|nr:PSP1 C-terminal conserved region-domain-containing protein [Vararia minispora EC-137]